MTTVKGEDCIRAEESYRATVAIEKNVAVEPANKPRVSVPNRFQTSTSIHYSVGAPAQCVGPRVRPPRGWLLRAHLIQDFEDGLEVFWREHFWSG
jgi:hypothetical protein